MLKELYNVAYGQRIDLNTLAASIMEITGISVPLVYEPSRVGDVWDSRVDIRRTEEAFGYKLHIR
jgi:UDP-glucose 4-epimerase